MTSLLIIFTGFALYVVGLIALLKTNAGVMFLAACSGLVLLSSIDPVLLTTAASIVPSEGEAYVRLAVVFLSILFAAFLFRGTITGIRIAFHGILGLVLSVVLLLLLPENTGLSWLLSAVRQPLWGDINAYRGVLVALGLGLSLILILISTTKKSK